MSVISKRKHHWAADSDLTSRVTVIAKRRERANWNAAPVRGHIDQNGFGRKMLEKFGWSPGEGLGAQKQGIKEHLRARKKSDNAGIGFKDSGEEWLKHQNDFSELLANLSGENTEVEENDVSISAGKASLELKSKQSRARVHYHKFTRGKDLSRYSSKDLAQILGPDTLKSHASKKTSGDNVNHLNRGSMLDYFKKKAVLWDVDSKSNCKSIETAESKNKSELLTIASHDDDNGSSQYSGKKNKNENCMTLSMETSNNVLQSSMNPICDKQEYRKKKKKKEKLSLSTTEDNVNNSSLACELEGNFTIENISNSMENKPDGPESDKQKRKRKRQKQHDTDRNENSINIENEDCPEEFVENNLYILPYKKKNKRKE